MTDNLIDPSASGHPVLSQNFLQHPQDLLPGDFSALDQAHDHPHMLHQRLTPWLGILLPPAFNPVGRRAQRVGSPTLLVQVLFLFLALGILIILHTPAGGLSLTVNLFAAERATQLRAPGVSGIGEKEDPAMPASLQASSQPGLVFQNRSQEQIILQYQRTNPFPVVPVLTELKMLLDPYCKKP